MRIKSTGQFEREDSREYLYRNLDLNGDGGCWNWTGTLNPQGYGMFKNRAMAEYLGIKVGLAASRASWIIHNGLVERTDWVLHKCDNPACCNPAHLYVGTPQQNVDDMVSRERNSRGTDRPAAKLKEDDIREIRRLGDAGVSYRKIAAQFGIASNNAYLIVKRRGWKHVN